MSKQAYQWAAALTVPVKPGGSSVLAKSVLLCLAWHADADGQNARPSRSTISTHTGASVRSIVRALQQLEECGAISKQSGHNNHSTATYALNLKSDSLSFKSANVSNFKSDSLSLKSANVSFKSANVSVKSANVSPKQINSNNRLTDESAATTELINKWVDISGQLAVSPVDGRALTNIISIHGVDKFRAALDELDRDKKKMAQVGKPWRRLSIKAILDRIERAEQRRKKTVGVSLDDAWGRSRPSAQQSSLFEKLGKESAR